MLEMKCLRINVARDGLIIYEISGSERHSGQSERTDQVVPKGWWWIIIYSYIPSQNGKVSLQ